jgi:protein O-GlcNAc transferase
LSDPTHIAGLLQAGLEHHKAEHCHEAELKYREVLGADARNADALHLLGLIGCKAGQYRQGIQLFQQAIGIRPGFADAWNNLGVALRTLQRSEEAVAAFQEAVRSRPEFAEAHYNLAATLHALGRSNEALSHFETCVQLKPGFAPAHQALAQIRNASGLSEQPDHISAEALFGQAAALVQAGRINEAVEIYRRGLAINPKADGAWNCLGNALQELGRLEDAVDAYERVLALVPDSADALNNIGNVCQRAGKLDRAIEAYEQALRVQPHHLPAHGNLGVLYKDLGNLDQAAEHFQAALTIRPSSLARALQATLLPPVYSSLEDAAAWLSRLEVNLESLRAEKPTFDLTSEAVPNLFYLAYQGGYDRHIQQTLAGIYLAGNQGDLTPWPNSHSPGGKIRVGILSKQLRDHTIGTLMRGLFATLDRSVFHVTALPFFAGRDAVTDFIRSHADRYVVVPDNVAAATAVNRGAAARYPVSRRYRHGSADLHAGVLTTGACSVHDLGASGDLRHFHDRLLHFQRADRTARRGRTLLGNVDPSQIAAVLLLPAHAVSRAKKPCSLRLRCARSSVWLLANAVQVPSGIR